MQGWRRSNEDAHVCAINIDPGIHFFAVFDGHGGIEVAKYCEKFVIAELKADQCYKQKNYEEALRRTFIAID